MMKAVSTAAGARQAGGHLSPEAVDTLLACFKRRLHSYTYLNQAGL